MWLACHQTTRPILRGAAIVSLKGMPSLPHDQTPLSERQRAFIYYFTATAVDLIVLGLFNEYFPDNVYVEGFSILLLASVLIQALMKVTIAVEHRVAHYCSLKPGKFWRFMRFFGAWAILFVSKIVILEVLPFVLFGKVQFHGVLHGFLWLLAVVTVMLLAEEILLRVFRSLAASKVGPQGDLSSQHG